MIQDEENLPVLVEVMEQYAGLETEHVAHGDSGDEGYAWCSIPARTSSCLITRSHAAGARRLPGRAQEAIMESSPTRR